jgi:hypothetical protein
MSTVLVRVSRNRRILANIGESRYGVYGVESERLREEDDYRNKGEWFEVDEREVDRIVGVLAPLNPGKDVQVYTLTQVSTCPAAAMVTKQGSKDGILPA